MRCFNHSDIDAVGTCKVCQKGVCHACAVDLTHSLACKGPHEEQAEAVQALVQRNMRVQGEAGKARYVAPVFFGFMGAVFLFTDLRHGLDQAGMGALLGLGFVAFGIVCLVVNRRAYGAAQHRREAR
jgi:hypothetical protein